MVFKTLLIVLVFAVLMEDSASIRKTEEEKKEDKEVAKAVNRTLAEEEKQKEEDERKKRDEKKRKEKGPEEEKDGPAGKQKKEVDQDKACPTSHNLTCPVVEPCADPVECPEPEKCPTPTVCPKVEPCEPCGPCPPEKPRPGVNTTDRPCTPCKPCLEANGTIIHLDCPSPPSCVEPASMSVPEAMAVGAIASLLVAGVATAIGLLLRYAPPLFSGLLFVAIVVLTWYLSSHYPETARELGGRVVATLREATIALGHRVMEAIRHHQEQVGVPAKPNLFFKMSSMFFI
jgi:hypothetical protein